MVRLVEIRLDKTKKRGSNKLSYYMPLTAVCYSGLTSHCMSSLQPIKEEESATRDDMSRATDVSYNTTTCPINTRLINQASI